MVSVFEYRPNEYNEIDTFNCIFRDVRQFRGIETSVDQQHL
jgi:hypothetical protein